MHLLEKIRTEIIDLTSRQFGQAPDPATLAIGPTKKEFEGDVTVVVFPLVKVLRKSPAEIGETIGSHLTEQIKEVESYNVVQGFLNISFSDLFWKDFVESTLNGESVYGNHPSVGEKVMIEYASPNTNKPLHLGHLRNILLGWSTANIMEAAGFKVVRVQVVNDRGIAICKSMSAWKKFADGATPKSTQTKGDHFVGAYYVKFEEAFRAEYDSWQKTSEGQEIFAEKKSAGQSSEDFFKAFKNTYFNTFSALGNEAREMLKSWEDGDEETMELWRRMNGWVYDGFDKTYANIGVTFDKLYYESDTWKLGRKEVLAGVDVNKFYKKEDGSVWVDLTSAGMDQKILLRSDGTSVYMTQDIGTAISRYRDYGIDRMVYVVGDEQNYHFKVLFEILQLLEQPYADGLHHLSYGMVDLPTGRMKTREGTVVDADDLMSEVIDKARAVALERGDLGALSEQEKADVYRKIGLAALKFFILKVNPQRRMIFDPEASVDLQGQTGPYVQNAFVRIRSVLRKHDGKMTSADDYHKLADLERLLANQLFIYPGLVKRAAAEYDPSIIANYCYDLAKTFHRFYHDHPILNAEEPGAKAFRLNLAQAVAQVLSHGMNLLGIEMPQRM